MDFDLSKPQKLLKETARQFLARECKPERVRRLMESDTAYDAALWRAMADQGWTGLIVPEEFGGLGTGVVELAAVCEEMGRACLPGPFLSTLFAAALIRAAGTREQKARFLEPIAAGDMKATVAVLEESANWDLNAIRFRSSGRKLFVTDAGVADVILCVAREDDKLIVVPVSRGAFTVKPMRAMDDTRKMYEVTFDKLASGEALQGERKRSARRSISPPWRCAPKWSAGCSGSSTPPSSTRRHGSSSENRSDRSRPSSINAPTCC